MEDKISVVTGAKGYVGHTLVDELAKRGEHIRLSLHSDCNDFDAYENCEKIFGDVCKLDHLKEVFAGAETVYHIAGIVDITGERDKLVWAVNYEGTKNVVEACKACGVKNLVFVSSVDCIPVSDDMPVITEPSTFSPDNIEGAYGKSKAAATQFVVDSNCDELKCVAVLPSCVIGPNDIHGNSSPCEMIKLYLKGLFPVSLNFGGYNFVDVRDVAKGMIAAAEKGRGGEVYFLCGEVLTVDQFIATLADINGKKAPKIKLGKKTLLKLCPLIGAFFKAMKWPPVLTEFSIGKICENCRFSYEKAKTELGYEPMTARKSLEDTVNFIKSNM